MSRNYYSPAKQYEWVHPSYRDLVIEELASDPILRKSYITKGGLQAIKLALSDVGGAEGKRRLPFLKEPSDWDAVTDACSHLLETNFNESTTNLLELFASLTDGFPILTPELSGLMTHVVQAICTKWNATKSIIGSLDLQRYFKIASNTISELPYPFLDLTWSSVHADFLTGLRDATDGRDTLSEEDFDEWVKLMATLTEHSPQTLIRSKYYSAKEALIKDLVEVLDGELSLDPDMTSGEDPEYESHRKDSLATTLRTLARIERERADDLNDLADRAGELSDQYSGKVHEPDDDTYQSESWAPREKIFDIEALFSDI
jgi:hypothetical protein